ncbi:ribosomal protection-like ABC-F family protein [Paenibacillus sp. KN14-4R]|uniref:ribosomal protection-like ABC-F family protein n=1 Tax=Paenibacillus sp. KN14-4R TaxID=3445773 RepID=UPI003FA030FE
MMMITFQHIQKYYGATLAISDVTFDVRQGERVALIGRNGAGKTTIFHLIKGTLKPDQGQISIRKDSKIGFLAQIPNYADMTNVYEVLGEGFREMRLWQEQMKVLEQQMADPEQLADADALNQLLMQYGRLQEKFEREGGYEMDARIDRIASGLGIPASQYTRPFTSLSGGEKTKVGLAALLLTQPDILLLDEPTNHLDMNAIEWLEQYLVTYSGTVLVISHDRYFLDKVVTKVVDIEDGEASTYHTNYSGFQKEKELRLLNQFAEFQEQQKKIKKMKESIKQLIDWGNRGNPPNPAFHTRAASMQKALDRMEKIKRPVLERKSIDLHLTQNDRSGKQVLTLDGISKTLSNKTLFTNIQEQLQYGERVMLIGNNGTGKSTILKMILGNVHPDEGDIRVGSRVDIGYLAQENAPLENKKTVLQYFREELGMEEGEARGQLARFLFFGADVFKQVRGLSGGEWSRLRLALLMYRKPNLLLLDEPTNHLDIDSREALEETLEDFPGTLLAVSHDRYFINRLAHKIWSLDRGSIMTYLGNFDHYLEKRAPQVSGLTFGGDTAPISVITRPSVDTRQDEGSSGRKTDETKVRSGKSGIKPFTMARLESDIAQLEARLQELDAQMLAPDTCSDAEKLTTIQTDRDQVQAMLDQLYERWMVSSDT